MVFEKYDTDELLNNINRLNRFEKTIVEKNLTAPTTEFSIDVLLRLTKIYCAYRASKELRFIQKKSKILLLS